MAKGKMDLGAFVSKLFADDDDVLREGVRVLAQALMDTEVSSQIGAELYERTESRSAHRNGSRPRTWNTRVDTIELRIPKITPGTYFPRAARAAAALGESAPQCGPGGLRPRRIDAQGRRPCARSRPLRV